MEATPLLWAIRAGDLRSVVLLAQSGADIGAADKNGQDAFMTAAGGDHPHILAYLLAKHALSKETTIGNADLVGGVEMEGEGAAGDSVDGKSAAEDASLPPPNVFDRRDAEGRTAAMYAMQCQTVHPLRALHFHGADLNAVDHQNRSLLHYAIESSPATFYVCTYLAKCSRVSDRGAFGGYEALFILCS